MMPTHASTALRTQMSPGQLEALRQIADVGQVAIPLDDIVPASCYVDPAWYEREKQAIFRREPMLIAPGAVLPGPGTYYATKVVDTPLLLTRAADGRARAFLNVCRHRGTILCPAKGSHTGTRLSCPYHAWTYKLDGSLMAVPRRDTFADLDFDALALAELPCREIGGLVFAGLYHGEEVDFSIVEGDMAEDLIGIGMDRATIYNSTTFDVAANWKLLQDTMLDNYHVQRLHQNTLAKFFEDNTEFTDLVNGLHVRSASGRKGFVTNDIHADFEVARRRATLGYALYPQGSIVTSPRYTSLCIFRPLAFDRTEADYYIMVTDRAGDEQSEAKLAESWELMKVGFGDEDFWAAALGHEGLATGIVPQMLIGGLERRISLFHDAMIARMAQHGFPPG